MQIYRINTATLSSNLFSNAGGWCNPSLKNFILHVSFFEKIDVWMIGNMHVQYRRMRPQEVASWMAVIAGYDIHVRRTSKYLNMLAMMVVQHPVTIMGFNRIAEEVTNSDPCGPEIHTMAAISQSTFDVDN
ncbi:hypothetical protein SUGI_0316970 [Cryptomeria japonica]|nr:hypothetical protein SUGI_0316970 [Cryptomeria japonica]